MTAHRMRLLAPLAALLAVSACTDQSTPGTSPAEQPSELLASSPLSGGLLACEPLAADSVGVTIGPAGGVIVVGPHVLSVPEGALAADVTITAVAPSDTVRRVVFAPDGLQFAKPAELQLSYADCGLVGSLLPRRIVQVSDDLAILAVLPSLDLRSLFTTRAPLEHFSGYAVAW